MKETIDQICADLREGNRVAVKRVVAAIGAEQSLTLLTQALELEAKGGMLTRDGQRRRTPGGIFFQLARAVVPKDQYPRVFPPTYQLRRAKRHREQAQSGNAGMKIDTGAPTERQDSAKQGTSASLTISNSEQSKPPKEAAAKAPTVPPMTWEEAKALIGQCIKTPGEASTVKLSLIGRPLKVIQQQDCVVVSFKGKTPPSLPKGLPALPDGSAITWAVFIVNKQWHKVRASIETHADDTLIIEGYPIVGKNGVAAVMATNCKSLLMERMTREQKQAQA